MPKREATNLQPKRKKGTAPVSGDAEKDCPKRLVSEFKARTEADGKG